MAFDFKKEYKEFYLPPAKPVVVTVPKANYIAVRGKGDPNEEGGAYQQAIGIAAGGILVAGRHRRSRLQRQIDLLLDFRHPSAGFYHQGRFRLGGADCVQKEKDRLFLRRVPDD